MLRLCKKKELYLNFGASLGGLSIPSGVGRKNILKLELGLNVSA